jgi:hypothetical protein
MSPQRPHKAEHEYSANPTAIYNRLRRERNPAIRVKEKTQQARRHAELMASSPEYRQAHNARNNARLKARRQNPDTWPRIALNQIRTRALKKGLAFDLTPEDISAPVHCPVLGIKLEYGAKLANFSSPTLDRLRPALGYVKGNVNVISHRANTIKSNATSVEVQAVADWMRAEGL